MVKKTRSTKPAKNSLARFPNDPQLEPLNVTLSKAGGRPVEGVRACHEGDAGKNLIEFATKGLTDWSDRPPDYATMLLRAYDNAYVADRAVAVCAEQLRTMNLSPGLRADNAGTNVIVAAAMVRSALLMNIQREDWYANSALIVLRTALELAATGGFIALGAENEAIVWEERERLQEQEIKSYERMFSARKRCDCIRPELESRDPTAPDPYEVYGWLCSFTHFDVTAVGMNFKGGSDQIRQTTVLAPLAYVSWVCAVVAEVVTGIAGLAQPGNWKAVPWKAVKGPAAAAAVKT
jgi:hypothetical protein